MRRLALVLVLLAAASGCTHVAGAPGGGGAAESSRTLRVGEYEEPDTLSPIVSQEAVTTDADNLVFDGLIRYDRHGELIPDLATAVPSRANGGISSDGRTITYHLRRGVRWQDGAPFTARDVIFTWHALMNPRNDVPTRVGYDQIASITAPDPYTVVVHLKRPYAPAIYLFRCANQGAIVPAHLLERYRDLNRVAFNEHPIGTGPYRVISWSHGQRLRFEANPYYWKHPKIRRIDWIFIHDTNTLLNALRTHEIDVYPSVPAQQVPLIESVRGVRVESAATAHWEHLNFNLRPGSGPQAELAVRRAMVLGLDERAVYGAIYHGEGGLGPTDQAPSLWAFDPAVHYYPFDPAAARALLRRAGWRPAKDGYRYRNGHRLTVEISTVSGVQNREAFEVVYQQEMRAIGIDLRVKNAPAQTLFAPAGAGGLIFSGRYQVALFAWEDAIPDPDDQTFVGPHALPPKGQNASWYVDPQVGRWGEEALRTYDRGKRRQLYFKEQRALIRDLPFYTLDWLPQIDAASADLHGLHPVPVGSDFYNVADWSLRGR